MEKYRDIMAGNKCTHVTYVSLGVTPQHHVMSCRFLSSQVKSGKVKSHDVVWCDVTPGHVLRCIGRMCTTAASHPPHSECI